MRTYTDTVDTTLVRYHTQIAVCTCCACFPKNMMMMHQQVPRIRCVSQVLFRFAVLASLSTKLFMVLHLSPSKTNTSNKAWGDAVRWLRMRLIQGWRKSRDARQPVNLESVNNRLTRTWSVLLFLVRTWFVPLLVCDHSQGVYFPPNTGGGV